MSRLTKKERMEWSLFIHPDTGRITFHPKCRGCIHSCKQSYRATLFCETKYVSKKSAAQAQKRQNTTV